MTVTFFYLKFSNDKVHIFDLRHMLDKILGYMKTPIGQSIIAVVLFVLLAAVLFIIVFN